MRDKPAYPIPSLAGKGMPGAGDCNGLNRRELFAAMAMQGLMAGDLELIQEDAPDLIPQIAALTAVRVADALIEELDK